MTFHGFDGIRSTQPTVLLTQQAPVRRGPRASARSPCLGDLSCHGFAHRIHHSTQAVLLTQQAPVRRGPRASATSLVTVSLAESEADFLPNGVCRNSCPTRSSKQKLCLIFYDFSWF